MTTIEACKHHWMIAEPAGSYSTGICKKCHAERDFKNSEEDFRYGPDGHVSPFSEAQHERAILAANAGRRTQAQEARKQRWPMPTAPGVRTDH